MQIQPYLDFDGRCEEALGFYAETLGAEVTMLMRIEESPEPPPDGMIAPGSGKKIMHSEVKIGDSTIMATDGYCGGEPKFAGVTLSITVPDAETGERVFEALAEGGEIKMPFGETFWSPGFGMLDDRFGVAWMVNTFSDRPPGA